MAPHEQSGKTPEGERLQRVLARAGVAARRACEALIEEGRVKVNGQVVRTLPCFVQPGRDKITVDGTPIGRSAKPVYVLFNKPAKVLTTMKDEPMADRKTVSTLVNHPSGARLFPVGRLEFDAMGLVLLTNDGSLTHRLTHPRFGITKVYNVPVTGPIPTAEGLRVLERGIARAEKKDAKREGVLHSAWAELTVRGASGDKFLLEVTMRNGSASNILSVLLAGGYKVGPIERVALGPVALTGVARGRWRELDRHEIKALKAAARGESDGEGAGPRRGAGPRDRRSRPASRSTNASAARQTDRRSRRSGPGNAAAPSNRSSSPAAHSSRRSAPRSRRPVSE